MESKAIDVFFIFSFQERLQELELRLHEEEVAERMNIEHKKAVIIDAFNRQEEQLDDSKLVNIYNWLQKFFFI